MDVNESIEWIRQQAGVARYLNEVKLNVQMTSWAVHAGLGAALTMDLVKTTEKFRAMGAIQ